MTGERTMATTITLNGANGAVTEFQGTAIPMGCICAYTWSGIPGRLIRNGALRSCTADHEAHGV